jgi:hypothetical protein
MYGEETNSVPYRESNSPSLFLLGTSPFLLSIISLPQSEITFDLCTDAAVSQEVRFLFLTAEPGLITSDFM